MTQLEEVVQFLALLRETDWEADAPLVSRFLDSPYTPLLEEAVRTLDLSALYQSHTHGLGHILRTLCHGAMGAMEERLSMEDARLLLDACSYHDVGRINDSEDNEHGRRSAARLAGLTGRSGDELAQLQAAVDVHSRSDALLPAILERYQVRDTARATLLAQLLKDADGLDRVRIWDLDVNYLRRPHSKARARFAKRLYLRYQSAVGSAPVPEFVQKWKKLDAYGNPL